MHGGGKCKVSEDMYFAKLPTKNNTCNTMRMLVTSVNLNANHELNKLQLTTTILTIIRGICILKFVSVSVNVDRCGLI